MGPFVDLGPVDDELDPCGAQYRRTGRGPRGKYQGRHPCSLSQPVRHRRYVERVTDLSALSDPRRCAVVTMELERGVVGDLATMAQLAEAASERGTLDACGRLVAAARSAGVPVVHCIAEWAPDRAGTPLNTPLFRSLTKNPGQILSGTAAVDLVPELGDTSGDLRSVRRHGLTPFPGTDLHDLLRTAGVDVVVACGVSLNAGVLGLCLGAVDLGYEVVLPADATVGVPVEYGDAVLRSTMAAVATLTTVDELVGRWS